MIHITLDRPDKDTEKTEHKAVHRKAVKKTSSSKKKEATE